jgi:prepilin-type N-terminal cleavage/methylation domain-containing protein
VAATRRVGGFTLIELLVVLAVVGLLLSIVAPRAVEHVERAKETTLRATLKAMRSAIDQFEADRGVPPASLEELVQLRYLRELPVDPLTDRRDTWVVQSPAEVLAARAFDAAAPLPAAGTVPAAGVADVRSGAPGQSRDGTAYAQW